MAEAQRHEAEVLARRLQAEGIEAVLRDIIAGGPARSGTPARARGPSQR